MSRTLSEKSRDGRAKVLAGPAPQKIEWSTTGGLAEITFEDETTGHGSCIRCPTAPCINYSEDELRPAALSDFPYDALSSVCPTGAIKWPLQMTSPTVQQDLCISCGLCIARCPVRAIAFDEDGAFVNDLTDNHWLEVSAFVTEQSVADLTQAFQGIPETGSYREETYEALARLKAGVAEAIREQGPQFPNLFCRNLLLALGFSAGMRRRGDQSMRVDILLGPPGVGVGIAEVETGGAIIEAPRNVLDDVAVLVSRYGVRQTAMTCVIVTDSLPNARSEYWQVLKDIKNVLGIRIASLTIGALVVALWSRTKLSFGTSGDYYIDVDSPSLTPYLERDLGRPLHCTSGYSGCFESAK